MSLRQKKRFVSVRFYSDKQIPFKELSDALEKHFLDSLGVQGKAVQNPKIINFDSKKGILTLRTSLNSVKQTIVSLLLIKKIGLVTVIPKIIEVSGSVKKWRYKL